jgi:hypothetical protein
MVNKAAPAVAQLALAADDEGWWGGGRLEHPSGTGEGQGKQKLTRKDSPRWHGPIGGGWRW